MERVKRLKSCLQHKKMGGGGVLCVRGASCECVVAYRGGLHKNCCCRIITRALFALLWILPEAVPWATNSPGVQNRWATRPCVHYYAVYSKYSKLTPLHLSWFTNPKYLKHNSRNFQTRCTLTLHSTCWCLHTSRFPLFICRSSLLTGETSLVSPMSFFIYST